MAFGRWSDVRSGLTEDSGRRPELSFHQFRFFNPSEHLPRNDWLMKARGEGTFAE